MSEQKDPQKAVRVRITGRVQGVGYRYWAARLAERLGVSGWVRNEVDGSVAVVCEGSEDAVDRFLKSIRQGPPGAWVEHVEITKIPHQVTLKGFTIEF